MIRTDKPKANLTGRASTGLASQLRTRIQAGQFASGDFLPSVRELCGQHELAIETVCRGLRILESEGLITAVPRRGYRVLAKANDPAKACPVAYLLAQSIAAGGWEATINVLRTSVQNACVGRGWTALGMTVSDNQEEQMIQYLQGVRAWGVLLDCMQPRLTELVRGTGMPVVAVDSRAPGVDSVSKDDFGGGERAVEYLLKKGHRRIAWFGPHSESSQSKERFGGARSVLIAEGMDFACSSGHDRLSVQLAQEARAMLSRADRPTAVLALWQQVALPIVIAARELGLVIGKDIELIGWCAEEIYADAFLPSMGAKVPAVVWSAATMAETALARLLERRANPKLPTVRIDVETRLKVPD
jgi:DNA-binding LacI/PurR family transcriptional regulator